MGKVRYRGYAFSRVAINAGDENARTDWYEFDADPADSVDVKAEVLFALSRAVHEEKGPRLDIAGRAWTGATELYFEEVPDEQARAATVRKALSQDARGLLKALYANPPGHRASFEPPDAHQAPFRELRRAGCVTRYRDTTEITLLGVAVVQASGQ